MSFFSKLFGVRFGKARDSKAHSRLLSPTSTSPPRNAASSSASAQRKLLRTVLGRTLKHHGIPEAWIGLETLLATSRTGATGLHLRLLIRHWEPRLLIHAVALQDSLIVRLLALDPLAANWLMGISWKFALPDEAVCPPMPHPGLWTAETGHGIREYAGPEAIGGSADVIAGPVHIDATSRASGPDPSPDVKADLERLFAVRDAELAELKLHTGRTPAAGVGPDVTQPMFLKTRPMDPQTDHQPLEPDS